MAEGDEKSSPRAEMPEKETNEKMGEKTADTVDQKKDRSSQSDESIPKPTEAMPEPKPDEPKEMDGWSAYAVR